MSQAFLERMKGSFRGMLHWSDLDALWEKVREQPAGWYISMAGDPPPQETVSPEALLAFVNEVDALLRREHDCTHCGIVYADDIEQPLIIKIHDPNNIGSSCSSSVPAPPRWILSRMPPALVADATPLPGNRRRWWQSLFGT